VLGDDVLLVRRGAPFVHVRLQLADERRRHSHTLTRPPMLMVKICQPSHEFTFGVGISFIPYPLVLTPMV
jgi:hypothetical protein